MKKGKGIAILCIVLACILGLGYYASIILSSTGRGENQNITLGLDLAGGVSITYQIVDEGATSEQISDTVYKLQRRVDDYSTEAQVAREGSDRITVAIPGVTDANDILEELGTPGSLEFQDPDGNVVLTCYALVRISVGSTFIAVMLTILGYSINDTIVTFDRIRENLRSKSRVTESELKEIANRSITQTLSRSINTSVTTFVMVLLLYILGVASIREFALPLMVGVISGTYSSICIATELWFEMKIRQKSSGEKKKSVKKKMA